MAESLDGTFLRDIAESDSHFACYRRCYRFVVCLSVTFVDCAQMAEDIDTTFLAHDSPMSLPDRVKIWLISVDPINLAFDLIK